MSNYIITDGGELYHYGVKGMKWGHRKAQYYETKAGRLQGKVDTKRTSYGKISAQNKASTYQYRADRARSIADAKGIRGKYEAGYGHTAAAQRMRAQEKMNKQQSSYAKSRLGKQIFDVSAQNSAHLATYHEKVVNSKNAGERFVNQYIGIYKTPITNLSGRTTTRGKAIAESMIPGLSQVRDIKYLMDKKKYA